MALKETLFDKPNEFFVSKREYFTLIIAIVVSLTFMFNSRQPQVEAVRSWLVKCLAYVQQEVSWYHGITTRTAEIAQERRRAAELMIENSQLREALLENHRLRRLLAFQGRASLRLLPARVLARQVHPFHRAIELNVGSRQGVQRNMAVVMPGGLAGKIAEVYEHTSTVQLLEDHNFKASARIQRSRELGIVEFDEREGLLLSSVAKNSDVKPGDVVVTSEVSSLFPPGIRIGVVSSVNTDNPSLFMDIVVTPDVDVSVLEEVFVVVAPPADSTN